MNAAVAAALAALALAAAPRTPEKDIGLAKTTPDEVAAPARVNENESAPGERSVRPRPFPGAAPAIPHAIGDFLPITKAANACVDCHAVAKKVKGEPTPIPASHYVDLRNAPEKRQDHVAGARWNCNACHVPQQDVKPLVKNPFAH